MAATKAELWAQLANAIKIIDETWKFGGNNATSIVGLEDTLIQSLEGNHSSATTSAVASLRDSLSTASVDTTILDSIILELATNAYDSLATDVDTALDDIAKGLDADTETIAERNITYGSLVTGGSNVGDGILYRLTTDKYANKIETCSFDGGTTRLTINTDKNTGATSGAETGLLYGDGRKPVDNLDLGDAPEGSITLTAKRASDGLLTNGGFETSSGTGATLAFSGWTLSDPTDFLEESSAVFRGDQAISFEDNGNILQHIVTSGNSIDQTKPVFLIVRYYRDASVDGSLTIRLGSKTATVPDLTAVSAATWLDLYIGIDDEDGWYDEFKEDNSALGVRIQITLASRTVGNLIIDEVILAQPEQYDGKWYLLTAGENDYIVGDTFSFVDSVNGTAGGDGRMQFTFSRLYGKHMPHTSGSETYADA